MFDCWGLESFSPPPVIVLNINRLTLAGYNNVFYTGWTGTEAAHDADVQSANTALANVVAEFDGMVQIADIDVLIAKDATLTSDGIHPNELGSGKIVDAVILAMKRLTPGPQSASRTLSFNGPSRRMGALIRPRADNWWHFPPFSTHTGAAPGTAGDMYAIPFVVQQPRDVYDLFGLELTAIGTASATWRVGIYDDPDFSGFPDCLLPGGEPTSSTVWTPGIASTGLKTLATSSVPWRLDPALYWLVGLLVTAGTGQTYRFSTLTTPSTDSIYLPNATSAGVIMTSGTAPLAWKWTGQAVTALPGQFTTSVRTRANGTITNVAPMLGFHKAVQTS